MAYNKSGFSATANVIATTLVDPALLPSAPSTLAATAVSQSEISLSWTDESDDEDGFYVQMMDGSEWTTLLTLEADAKAALVEGLTESKVYFFRVAAFNALGSNASQEVTESTKAVGIETRESVSMNIMPNPATDVLYINSEQQLDWNLYSLTGKLMMSGSDKEINISNLNQGIYIIHLGNENKNTKQLSFVKK